MGRRISGMLEATEPNCVAAGRYKGFSGKPVPDSQFAFSSKENTGILQRRTANRNPAKREGNRGEGAHQCRLGFRFFHTLPPSRGAIPQLLLHPLVKRARGLQRRGRSRARVGTRRRRARRNSRA